MILKSVTIQLHLSWTEANSHNILYIFILCCHLVNVVFKGWVHVDIYLSFNLSFVRVSMLLASSCVTPMSDSLLMDMSWSPVFSLPS